MPANEKATMLKGPFSSDKVKRDGSIPVMYNEIPLLSRPGMSGFFVFRHSRCESLSRVDTLGLVTEPHVECAW